MNVNVHYGIDNTSKFVPGESTTVSNVVNNPTVKSALGYGDNIRVLMNGSEVPMGTTIYDGAELHIEVRANSKAAPASAETVRS